MSSSISFLERKLIDCKYAYLLHPIIIAPLGGLLLGNLSTGVSVGLILELIWGSNLFDYNFGLQYVNLAAILAVILNLTSNNITLIINVTLALLISYSLQELISNLYHEFDHSWLIEVGYFLFILTLISFTPIWKELLGLIPAQFLDELATAGGLLPALGLGAILAQAVSFKDVQSKSKFIYFLVILITFFLSLYTFRWLPIIFLLIWGGFSLLIKKIFISKVSLRFIVGAIVIIITPFLVEITGPLVNSQLKLVLWSEGFLSLCALLLLLFRITQFELYFLILILGVSLSKAGLLL
jgi:PTS system mannose-specific IIC component